MNRFGPPHRCVHRALPTKTNRSGHRVPPGRVEHGARYDWFSLEVPDERTDVVVQTDSWIHGSPLNPEIMVEGPDGEEVDRAYQHDASSNYDAKVEFTATEPGNYLIRVGTCCQGGTSRTGGHPYARSRLGSTCPHESGSSPAPSR